MTDALIIIGVLCITIPFVVYLSVKLGTYGYLRGKQLFEQNNQIEDETDEFKA